MNIAIASVRGQRALVVDDVSFNRRLVSTALSCDGLITDEASDAATAIAALERSQYEVVLLDLALGVGGSGYDVLQAIRSRSELDALPVLLVSGAANDPESIAKGLLAGANDFVTKPFDPTVLRARVAAALRSRQALLEVRARADHLSSESARVMDELTHARLVQRAALPHVPVRRKGFMATGEVVPSGHVSGDVFDVVIDAQGRLSAFLLDVAGHGASAAIVASAARVTLCHELAAGASLEATMASLVDCLRAQGDVLEATAAIAIARFNAAGNHVEVVNAGLPPVLCLGPGGSVRPFPSTSAPAGLFESTKHVVASAPVELCSLLTMASDGLTGKSLTTEELAPLIERLGRHGTLMASASREQLRGLIVELMALFGASSDEDDATLVVVANDDAPATLREGWAL